MKIFPCFLKLHKHFFPAELTAFSYLCIPVVEIYFLLMKHQICWYAQFVCLLNFQVLFYNFVILIGSVVTLVNLEVGEIPLLNSVIFLIDILTPERNSPSCEQYIYAGKVQQVR